MRFCLRVGKQGYTVFAVGKDNDLFIIKGLLIKRAVQIGAQIAVSPGAGRQFIKSAGFQRAIQHENGFVLAPLDHNPAERLVAAILLD